MYRLLAFLAALTAAVAVSGGAAAEPLRYEPAVVRLSGFLIVEQHFGPPNYGEDPETDSVEEALILLPDESVAVQGDPNDLDNSESYENIRRIQLVVEGREVWRWLGRHVTVEGTLFGAYTGHHRTKVLMRVKGFYPDPVIHRPNPALGP